MSRSKAAKAAGPTDLFAARHSFQNWASSQALERGIACQCCLAYGARSSAGLTVFRPQSQYTL